jgi:type VI secretion system secreted protein VgrG
MADITFDIKSDSPVNDDLLFWSIVGHETLSRPSFYELTVLSKNFHINTKDIIGKPFNVGVYFVDADNEAHERHFQGHAVNLVRVGQVGRYFQYHISLRSWFWLLTRRTNSRIYQDKSVLDVLDAVFEDSPIKRYKKTNIDNVIGTHKPRRYCVQHAESDYQFLSRLLEDEGIYYWFDSHEKGGTMHISDSSDLAHDALPANKKLRYSKEDDARFNEIVRWVSADRLDTGHHTGADNNFKTIRTKLVKTIDAAEEHDLSDFEMFESPGGFFNGEDAETKAKIRGDELAARRKRYWAVTGWPDVAAGSNFTFEGDPDGICDGDYLIASCTFVMTHPGYEGAHSKAKASSASILKVLHAALEDDAVNVQCLDTIEHIIETTPALRTGQLGASSFLLTVLPADQPYRPHRLTPSVIMPGPQSAIVVGAAGKEIDVDDFGRVKVQFHWDRYGTNDDKSTAWVRVSQPMAGKGWGGYFIPRIGQEVIVDFLNGDPDRPIITGRVYNSDQPIPYKSGTQSGFKTRSTPGGTPANYNEIMFEDKMGAENINIHAELNMSRSVENNDGITVGNNQSITVKNDRTVITEGNENREVVKDQRNVVHQHQHTTVTLCQYNHIGDHQQNIVGPGGQLNQVAGQVSTVVGQTMDVSVTGAMTYKSASWTIYSGPVAWSAGTFNLKSGALKINAADTDLTLAQTNITTKGNRSDVVSGTHKFKATDFNFLGTNFNRTVQEANDCILGQNNNAYIGISSDTNLALARSVFVGLNMSTALSLEISNFIGVKLENALAIAVEATAGIKVELSSVQLFTPGGAGGGGAAGSAALSGPGAFATGFGIGASTTAGLISLVHDGYQAVDQYDKAAKECEEEGLPDLARLARRRSAMVKGAVAGAVAGGAVLGPGGVIPGAVIGGLAGDASQSQ